MSDVIIVEKMDRWIKITLNRPERLNALNVEMHLAFRAALEAVGNARAVLITGAGRGFCAGQDLGERNPDNGHWPPDLGQTLNDYFNPLVRLITNLPMPVICAVNGVAAGAGANLPWHAMWFWQLIQRGLFRHFPKLGLCLMLVEAGFCHGALAWRGQWVWP